MTDVDFSDRISLLEGQIEELTKSVERCGKAMLIAKIAGVAGAIWLVAMMVGAVRFNSLGMIVSLSAMIGGVVMFGTSRSTLLQAGAAMKSAEAERAALIGALDLRIVDETRAPSIAGGRLWNAEPSPGCELQRRRRSENDG
ncbi:MAG: hypothetical protein ACRECO_05515 [Xanthobacteraceae bacterium]